MIFIVCVPDGTLATSMPGYAGPVGTGGRPGTIFCMVPAHDSVPSANGIAVAIDLPVSLALSNTQSSYNNFIDGNILGWGVALAMILAWSIHHLRRAL